MAELKRHMIELVKNVEEVEKGGEVQLERFWTPAFIPFKVVKEATQLQIELQGNEVTELEIMDKMSEFISQVVYKNAFTVDDLNERLHGPDALDTLQAQLLFVAQGEQNDATKKFLTEKKK